MENLIPISLIGAVFVFLLKLWVERASIRSAIITDMKLTLHRAKETLEYLEKDNHYWLQTHNVLTRSPSDIQVKSSIFLALLPKMYLLGPNTLSKILAFYAHYQYCEGLKASLFDHIDGHLKSQKPLTESDVDLLRLRKARICCGLASLISSCDRKYIRLHNLPIEYQIPSTAEIASQVNTSIKSKNSQRVFLP